MTVHKHEVFQLKGHDRYSQKLLISQWEFHQKRYCYQLLFSIDLSLKEGNVCTKSLSKTTLKFWKYIIKMIWKLFAHELFKYLRDNRQNTYWSTIILKFSRILFESRCSIDKFEKFSVFWLLDTFIELKNYLFIGVLDSKVAKSTFFNEKTGNLSLFNEKLVISTISNQKVSNVTNSTFLMKK